MRELIKNNKWKLIISSLVILLPIAVGLILWDQLPAAMNTHWGIDGKADSSASRAFAVFGLPAIILAVHWLCLFITSFDKKNKGQNKKVFSLIFFIIPFVSLFASFTVYAFAFGMEFDMIAVMLIVIGLLFVIIGNYMPKCRQNSTIGIKLPWTLANEENWNATHRLGGKLWVGGGAVIMLSVFLPNIVRLIIFAVLLLTMVTVPTVYSADYHKKQVKAGTADEGEVKALAKKSKPAVIISVIATIVILALCGVLCFTGDIAVECGESSFTVKADYYDDLTVEYAAIESVDYIENDDVGVRAFGFGSPRLCMGTFKSDTYGKHTRYSYTGVKACVVIKVSDETLVIGGKNDSESLRIYEELSSYTAIK